jgi:hypothetical protein
MSDTLRVTLPDGRGLTAPVALWVSAILAALGPEVGAIVERVAAMQADQTRLVQANGAPIHGLRTAREG